MKARTATLLSIAGVLAASSVAAIVNAQVLRTDDDSRTQVPVPVTSTAYVEPSGPISTVVVDVPTSADPIMLPTDTTPLTTDANAMTEGTTVATQQSPPVNVSPTAPLPNEISGPTAMPLPGTTARSSPAPPTTGTTPGPDTSHDDQQDQEDHDDDHTGEDRSGDDD